MTEKLESKQLLGFRDARLDNRFETMLNSMFKNPTNSIPETFIDPYQTKAAYRFFDNSKVEATNILKWHKETTYQKIANMEEENTLFVVQDTSDINYSTHESKKDMGPIQSKINHGIKIHPSIVITPTRIPIGIIETKIWSREEEVSTIPKIELRKQKAKERKLLPIEEKESFRWIESMEASKDLAAKFPTKRVINLADRECDINEYLTYCNDIKESNLYYIIRGYQARKTKEGEKLKEELYKSNAKGEISFTIKRGNKIRKVTQEIKYKEFELTLPKNQLNLGKLKLNAVLAEEKNVPKGSQPLDWILLTNMEIKDVSDAIMVIESYLCRWEIEIFFKVLKSGCKIEDLHLEQSSRIQNCVSMYMIIAIKIMFLMKFGRENPNLSGELIFSELEWRCLYTALGKNIPEQVPKLGELIRLLGQLGGYMNRKNDGPPGPKVIWLGTQRLSYIVMGFQMSPIV